MRWTDPADGRPLRHARVWLDAATWRASMVGVGPSGGAADGDHDTDKDIDELARWIDGGRALVACRRDPSIVDGCRLAAVLAGRRRVAVDVAAREVIRVAPPLRLDESVETAPAAWRDALRDLVLRGREVSAHFHVYGSLAWQTIGGDGDVTSASDVDLLWSAESMRHVDRVAASLHAWEAATSLRADGEALLPDGGGVAWRELAARPGRVLVKRVDRVSLEPVDRCFDGGVA